MRYHTKDSTLAIRLLKGIAITGIVIVAATNPYFGPKLLRALIKDREHKKPKATQKSLRYLKDRGYVKMLTMSDGRHKVEITKNGKKVIEHLLVTEMRVEKPEKWDESWRIVIFDVPNKKSSNRLAFTQNLRNIGFKMVQKSVWVYPYSCQKEIMVLRKYYGIENYVTYMETRMVEDDEVWRERFELSNV